MREHEVDSNLSNRRDPREKTKLQSEGQYSNELKRIYFFSASSDILCAKFDVALVMFFFGNPKQLLIIT